MLRSTFRAVGLASLVTFLVLSAGPAGAQIVEQRSGDANPMVSVFKSTVYGGLAGLTLGLAVELVDDDSDGDAVKWGFVSGTFFGFGYGVYHVATRPGPGSAMLEGGPSGWQVSAPRPRLAVRTGGAEGAGLHPDPGPSLDVRATVLGWRF